MEEMGMTDNQYKGMLLEDLENWEEVLELAKKANDKEVVVKAEKQIEKITFDFPKNIHPKKSK